MFLGMIWIRNEGTTAPEATAQPQGQDLLELGTDVP